MADLPSGQGRTIEVTILLRQKYLSECRCATDQDSLTATDPSMQHHAWRYVIVLDFPDPSRRRRVCETCYSIRPVKCRRSMMVQVIALQYGCIPGVEVSKRTWMLLLEIIEIVYQHT